MRRNEHDFFVHIIEVIAINDSFPKSEEKKDEVCKEIRQKKTLIQIKPKSVVLQ